jgi:hypothetical protein
MVSMAAAEDKPKAPADDAPKDLTPRLFTMDGKDLPLAKVLAALEEQTGNLVADRRSSRDQEAKIKLSLKNVTFWQAIDTIAKALDARVAPSESMRRNNPEAKERDAKDMNARFALVDGPFLALPVSYHGLFRVTITRIDLTQMLDSDDHNGSITMQVAWEPRFQPLLMKTKPDGIDIQDDKGRSVDVPDAGSGQGNVAGKSVATIRVGINAPQRSANQLKLFKGTLSAVGPSKTITFTFDKLAKTTPKNPRKQVVDGVTLFLQDLQTEGQENDVWRVGLRLEYPADGPKFESFQSWIVNNEIYLEKEKDGIKQLLPPNLGYETDDSDDNRAIVRYRFGDEPEKNLILGKFGDWKLTYKTPGKISEVSIPFEFKNVPLP